MPADDKKKDPAGAPAEGEEKKGSNPLVMIGIIVGIVVIQAVIAYLIIPKPVDESAKAEKAAADSVAATKRMGAVTSDAPLKATVNIAGTEGERYVKAAVILEYDEKNIQLGLELQKRAPKHNDLLIKHLATLTLMELTEVGAQDKIGGDLQRMINNLLPQKMGEVQNVLFTEFIIQ